MRHPHPVVALVLAVILVGLALTLVQALRNGEFGSRGRTYIVRRRKQPIQFWLTVVAGGGTLTMIAGLSARMIWEALSMS